MKITDENVSLLGNDKFCNKNEAINIAQKTNSSQIGWNLWEKMWTSVLKREDIQGIDALKYAKDLNKYHGTDIYSEILKRNDISWREAIEVLGDDNSLVIHEILDCKIDMPVFQALSYAIKFQPLNTLHDYIGLVLMRKDIKSLKAKRLLNLAERLNDETLWFNISLLDQVQKFMMKITTEKALFYLSKHVCGDVQNIILTRLDIHKNIALKHYKSANLPIYICISILSRPDISAKEAIYFAKKADNPVVLEAVMKREDVKEYLNLPNLIKEKA